MIDNHTMTVIANDLVPITPYKTNVLNIAMGKCTRIRNTHRPLTYFQDKDMTW
jgi:hypothetical protein